MRLMCMAVPQSNAVLSRLRAELAAALDHGRRLKLRVAELERRLGMDSSNSGAPTSKEPAGVLTAFLVCDGYEAYPRYPCCPAGTR